MRKKKLEIFGICAKKRKIFDALGFSEKKDTHLVVAFFSGHQRLVFTSADRRCSRVFKSSLLVQSRVDFVRVQQENFDSKIGGKFFVILVRLEKKKLIKNVLKRKVTPFREPF